VIPGRRQEGLNLAETPAVPSHQWGYQLPLPSTKDAPMSAPSEQFTTWEEALQHIEVEPVIWIRMAAVLTEDGWQVRVLEATSGIKPPSWDPTEWCYPRAWFVAFSAPGAVVADWFRNDRILWASHEVALPPSANSHQITWDRKGSGVRPSFEALGWASTEARMPSNWDPQQQEPQGSLLAEGAPSFVTFYSAAASFFWFDGQPAGGMIVTTVVYRHADTSGRIALVKVAGDYVQVDIEGRGFDGFTVELAGDVPGPHQQIWDQGEGTREVTFPLTNGLPSGAWVVLKSGIQWVDRRFLTHPFRRETESGVEWVVDPMTRLESLLAGRERIGVEFKSEVPRRRDESKLRMMKTVAAFANGNGGSVLVGVTDDRELIGIPKADVSSAIDALTEMIGKWVTPPPPHEFQELAIDEDGELVVLELIVGQGTHLYGAGKPNETPVVYVRPYSTTERARPSEIEDIVRARQNGQPRGWLQRGPFG
jgi:hypothetical protein